MVEDTEERKAERKAWLACCPLKILIKQSGLSHEAFCLVGRVTYGNLRDLLRGVSFPPFDTMRKFAHFLGVEHGWLWQKYIAWLSLLPAGHDHPSSRAMSRTAGEATRSVCPVVVEAAKQGMDLREVERRMGVVVRGLDNPCTLPRDALRYQSWEKVAAVLGLPPGHLISRIQRWADMLLPLSPTGRIALCASIEKEETK